MNKESKQVEEIFKEAFDRFEVDPGSNTWQAIQTKMVAEATATSASAASASTAASSSSWLATTIVATVISATAIGGYFFFNDTAEKIKSKDEVNEPQKEALIEEPSPAQSKSNDITIEANPTDEIASEKMIEEDQKTSNQIQTEKVDPVESKLTHNSKNNLSTTDDTSADKLRQDTIEETASEEQPTPSTENAETKENFNPIQRVADKGESKQPKKTVENSQEDTEPSTQNDEIEPKAIEAPIFNIPNVFSPNQDGINDEFVIDVDQYEEIEVQLFNQSNRLVFETNKLNDFWNGDMPNGSAAPEGYYFYRIVVIKDGKAFPKTGGVNLTR